MIDVWLLFNLIIPFALIILHTYMDFIRRYVDGILCLCFYKNFFSAKLKISQKMARKIYNCGAQSMF